MEAGITETAKPAFLLTNTEVKLNIGVSRLSFKLIWYIKVYRWESLMPK